MQRVTENATEGKIGSTFVEERFASLIMNPMGIRAPRKAEKSPSVYFRLSKQIHIYYFFMINIF